MCARDGRGAIELCLSEKGALAKKKIGKHCTMVFNELCCGVICIWHGFLALMLPRA